MPYIGNVPAENYAQVSYQDLTGGSGTSFTLDYPVGSAGEIEVFVNNVRQEPTVAYTVSGTSLTMTGSIAATDDFYVVFQGKAQQSIGIPEKQANGDYNFDSNTLFIDSSASSVGVGTATPDAKLKVVATGANLLVGYAGTQNYFDASENIFRNFSGTTLARIDSDGLKFNGDTAAANALDDYEEGTWTPTWGGTTSDGSVTYNVQNGYYTKVGRLVTLRGTIGITAISTSPSGYLLVKGLPFYNLSGSETVGSIGYGSCFTSGTFPDAIHVSNGSTSCYLYYSSSQGSPMVNSNTGSTLTTGVLYFAITYQAN